MLYKHLKRAIFALFISMVVLLAFFFNHASGANLEPQEPLSIEEYAYNQVVKTWGEDQWEYFDDLVTRESNWRVTAQNPNSSAKGLMQFLDSTWATVDCEKTLDGYKQIDCGIKYISARYGTVKEAIIHHNEMNWY